MRGLLAGLAAVVLASCSAGTLPMNAPQSIEQHRSGNVRFTVKIPAKTRALGRIGRFVSPATQSMTLSISSSTGGSPVLSETINLTNCSVVPCSVTAALAPGSYDATIATYDGTNASGNLLSEGQSLPFAVAAGKINNVTLTLSGVPHALVVTGDSRAVHGSQSVGLTIYGGAVQRLIVAAIDIDGNEIVGPGSPTYSASILRGKGWKIAAPSPSAPNVLLVSPPDSNGASGLGRITAGFPGGTTDPCKASSAVCSVSFGLTNDVPTLLIMSLAGLYAFQYPYIGAPQVNSRREGDVLALDNAGNLIDGNESPNFLYVYAPPYTGAPAPEGGTLLTVYAIGTSRLGYVAVALKPFSAINLYLPPYATPISTVTNGAAYPDAVAFGPNDDLFVGNASSCLNGTVTIYEPPYTGAPIINCIEMDQPVALLFNGAGDLFVANRGNDTINVFQPPYSGLPVATMSAPNLPARYDAIAVDSGGDLFAADDSGDNVVYEYAPPYTGTPITISNGIVRPSNLVVDGADDLIVGNCDTSCGGAGPDTVTIYAPPYTGAPVTTIDVNDPYALAVTP
jgi:hypothetical protein